MPRRIVDHLGDYDWDGSLADAAREICTLLSDADYRDIAYCFWQQYLSLPATQAIRHLFRGERLERRISAWTLASSSENENGLVR